MNEKDLQKKEIDRIGRALLGATRVSDEEIDKIIGSPALFESVKAGIKKEKSRRKPTRGWIDFPVWQTATGAFAILIILAACALIIFKTKDSQQLAAQVEATTNQTQIEPDEISSPAAEINATKNDAVKNPRLARRADFKAKTPKLKNRKTHPANPAQSPQNKDEGAFYSLAVAGQWEANGEDLQIVRTELSRSELFALGVNLPVENETPKIKTDLLVGANGVPRAIRFVE